MGPWLLAVPVLLAPVVLLLAYAGCDDVFGLQYIPPPKDPYGDVVFAEPGLVSFWRLDGPANTVTAVDSESGLDGTCSPRVILGVPGALDGPSYATEADDFTAAELPNGSAITVPAHLKLQPSHAFSVELWVKVEDYDTYLTLVSALVPDGPGFALGGTGTPAQTTINAIVQRDGATRLEVDATTPIDTRADAWHHVVLTYDAGTSGTETLVIYVDGEGKTVTSPQASYLPPGVGLMFGSDGTQLASFAGRMDEVAFYNLALGADAVAAHFAARSA